MGAPPPSISGEDPSRSSASFNINDNTDLLAGILCRLDGRSLGAAACVCQLWRAVSRRDYVWEALCTRRRGFGDGGASSRRVMAALGGYRRLYRICVGPVLDRLAVSGGGLPELPEAAGHLSLSLSLSLFSIDCYERLAGDWQDPTSLLFLCNKPVNVA